jgi:hypothetical protein
MVRRIKVKEGRPERERGSPDLGRNHRFTVAARWFYGEESRQPGGSLGRGKEGLQRRKARVIYRGQQLSS